MRQLPATDAWRVGLTAVSRCATTVYLLIRVSALGFTLVLPLVGAACVQRGALSVSTMLVMMSVALSFHVFAYVLNDVVDFWVDRNEPLRSDSPLVRGAVSRRQLLWLAWIQPVVAAALAVLLGATVPALLALATAFVAMGVYDIYGKRCRWPLLTDAVQSVGWCALVLVGAWWLEPATPVDAQWLVAYVFVCVMLVQGVHGGLRDLGNDLRSGARTTAVWMGARPGERDGIEVSVALGVYALALQLALIACAALSLAASPLDGQAFVLSGAAAGVALFIATWTLCRAYVCRFDRRRFLAAGAWNITCTLILLPMLFVAQLSAAAVALMMASLTLPIVAMFMYNGSHWRLQGPSMAEVT